MDDQNKKSSLRGRGRDIMRGFLNRGEQPPPSKPEEEPFFEDDQALLDWMTEEQPAPAASPAPEPAALYEEPNFDAIFASPQEEARPAQLEDIFKEEDVPFDELFGETINDVPQESEILGEVAPNSPEMAALVGMSQPDPVAPPVLGDYGDIPETVAAIDSFGEDFGASEADAISPELPDFDEVMGFVEEPVNEADAPTIMLRPAEMSFAEQPVEEHFSAPLPTPPTEAETFVLETENHEELEFGFGEHHDGDFSLDLEEEALPQAASGIPADPRSPVPEEADERLIPDGLDDQPAPRPDRRSPQINTTPDEEFYGDDDLVPGQEVLQEVVEEPAFMLDEVAPEPVYAESSSRAYTPPDVPTASEQAIPPHEANYQIVDLRGAKLERNALADITPQAPEEMPPDQRIEQPEDTFVPAQEYAEDIFEDAPEPAYAETYEPPVDNEPYEYIDQYAEQAPATMDDMVTARMAEVNNMPAPPPPAPEDAPYEGELFPLEEEELPVNEIGGTEPTYDYDTTQYEEAETPTRSGLLMAEATTGEYTDPFGASEARRPAREIFQPGTAVTPDAALLSMLVDDARIRELFNQIEALQEEVVNSVRGERGNTDTYQTELLEASNLLLQSRENYDEARAMIYRVRADINRERRVSQDIERYRPLLTFTFVAMVIVAITLLFLGNFFVDLAEDVGLAILGNGYFAAIFGMLGALWFGYRKMHQHTTVQRDFDPIHLNWYFVNPIMGLLTGFLVYLFLLSTTLTSLNDTNFEVIGLSPMTWVAAVAFGYNQNRLVNMLGSAGDRVTNREETRQ